MKGGFEVVMTAKARANIDTELVRLYNLATLVPKPLQGLYGDADI